MTEAEVSLRAVTAETLRAICALDVLPEQRDYVAPNVFSIAQAYFDDHAWFKAVYAGETPVGFVMIHDGENGEYFLWRLMIDREQQREGYGRRALDLIVADLRKRPGAREIVSSYVPGDDGPEAFYRAYGFVETGEVKNDEVVIRLSL